LQIYRLNLIYTKYFRISLIFTDKTRYCNENFTRKTFHQNLSKK